MILAPVLEADRVEYYVAVDMLTVNMSGNHALIFSECLLRKLTGYLMSKPRRDVVAFREALHQMIILSASCLVVEPLGDLHFLVGVDRGYS